MVTGLRSKGIDFRSSESQPASIKRLTAICCYLALLLISVPIPLLQSELHKAIEGMRPAYQMNDGSYVGGLLPGDLLAIRTLGELSVITLIVIASFFALSFYFEIFRRIEFIWALTTGQLAFTTLYTIFILISFLLRNSWLTH